MINLQQMPPAFDWQNPLESEEIMDYLQQFAAKNIRYGEDKILGFPGTTPHPISVPVFTQHLLMHANNIGMHTSTGPDAESEVGFNGTQEAERQVIAMCADLMGASLQTVDGYIASGGTEANIVGCWMGRNAVAGGTCAIVYSHAAHYTIPKAANLLNITDRRIIGTDTNGRLSIEQLDAELSKLIMRGISNIIVVATVGTTMLGSIDNVPAISKVVEKYRNAGSTSNIHLHVDAAFGGFVVPFISEAPRIGFQNPSVDSVTLDAHKMGFTPYGSGILLARKDLFKRIKTQAPYVPGDDATLTGSRAGVNALCCWAVMRSLGKSGYLTSTQKLLSLTEYVRDSLIGAGFDVFDSDMNIVGIKGSFPETLSKAGFITHIQKDFPTNLEYPDENALQPVWNIVVMPHTSKELIDELLRVIS